MEVERSDLGELMLRQNNLLDNLTQIFRHFLKLDTTSEGRAHLVKKLCMCESLKLFVEHITLFNKYDVLLPPSSSSSSSSSHVSDQQQQQQQQLEHRNFTLETLATLKSIGVTVSRRSDTDTDTSSVQPSSSKFKSKYPFTYMIDCLLTECRQYAATSSFLTTGVYPPKSLIHLLDVCLECNVSTKMKQILVLYTLCDLMHTSAAASADEQIRPLQHHMLKLINAYCSTKFTSMSANRLDSSAPPLVSTSTVDHTSNSSSTTTTTTPTSADATTSSSTTDKTTSTPTAATTTTATSSSLFDLVNAFYLIDARLMPRAFKYLRAADVNYLEAHEKYFILYDVASTGEFKTAAQCVWLFKKLNANAALFGQFGTMGGGLDDLAAPALADAQQRMHFRLIVTIYLANALLNEAYELIKPHIKRVVKCHHHQFAAAASSSSSTPFANRMQHAQQSFAASKDLIIHFLTETEQCKKKFSIKSLENTRFHRKKIY